MATIKWSVIPGGFIIMFGQSQKEPKPSESTALSERLTAEISEQTSALTTEEKPETEASELVKATEKISGIVSPYFIVVVGLLLYDSNFFLGTLLIGIGILSLLKFSWQDLLKIVQEIQELFNSP